MIDEVVEAAAEVAVDTVSYFSADEAFIFIVGLIVGAVLGGGLVALFG